MWITFGLLAATLLALWIPSGKGSGVAGWWWLGPALAALLAALSAGIVQPAGLGGIVLWVALVVGWRKTEQNAKCRAWHWMLAAGVLALTAALTLHRLPGFANPRVLDAVRFTPDAVPFTLYLNFDKTLIGLLLFGLVLPRITTGREWRDVLAQTLPRALLVIGVVLLTSLALGYVRWAPKLPAETLLFLGVNLLFTCTAEEALFRGFIQAQLQRVWKNIPRGSWLALGVAAGLFGLAHAAGGATYVVLAAIAGLGYGWIYQKTQRIEASILTHFALNSVHFFFFTYPALQP